MSLQIVPQIKAEMKRQGMTQTELSELMGYPQSAISEILKDKRDPAASTLERIGDALRCDLILKKRPKS